MTGKKKVHPLEEDWDVVQRPGRVLIKRRGVATRRGVLDTIERYSRHLRKDVLSARGRAYVADFLDKIVRGEDPLPKRPSRKRGPTDFDILNAYEKIKDYKKVAKQFGIKASTAEKRCSIARTFLKKVTL